ncbi:hypothetical protein IMZ48_41575 [Candidatus Bathyarchaeota archaeon]|nr:hypothetical protein [Candidatus Bathyarchaeota archaeon]
MMDLSAKPTYAATRVQSGKVASGERPGPRLFVLGMETSCAAADAEDGTNGNPPPIHAVVARIDV